MNSCIIVGRDLYSVQPMDTSSTTTINILAEQARQGDGAAESALFKHLSARFLLFAQHKILNREDAREIAQDALAVVAQKYRDMDFEVSFAAWAHKVLSNTILGHYKSKGRRDRRITTMTDAVADSASWTPDPDLEMRLVDCLRKIDALHERHAQVIDLHYRGYGSGDICRVMDLTTSNLYSLLSRARSMLKLCLEKGDIA